MLKKSPYTAGAVAAVGSYVGGAVAGFAALYFLTQILSKADFGAYAFSVNLVMLLAIVASLGLDRTLLLRIAGLGTGGARLKGTKLLKSVLTVSSGAGFTIAVLLWFLAGPIAETMATDVAGWWMQMMALAIVPLTFSALIRAWYQANHRVGESAVMPGVTDIVRAILIAAAFFAGTGKIGVAVAFIASTTVPFFVLLAMARGKTSSGDATVARGDITRGLVFAFQKITDSGLNLIDIVVIGLVAADVVAAEYAVAARFAAHCDIGRLALSPTFTPRVRRDFANRASESAAREYHLGRLIAFSVACLIAGVLAFVGQDLLAFFGDYQSAYAPLMVLAAGYVVTTGAGMHANYLAMTGAVRLPALIRVAGITVAIVGLTIFTPLVGSVGAAFAILVALIFMNAALLTVLWKRTGLVGLSLPMFLLVGGSAAVLCGGGIGLIPAPYVTALLFGAVISIVELEFGLRKLWSLGFSWVKQ